MIANHEPFGNLQSLQPVEPEFALVLTGTGPADAAAVAGLSQSNEGTGQGEGAPPTGDTGAQSEPLSSTLFEVPTGTLPALKGETAATAAPRVLVDYLRITFRDSEVTDVRDLFSNDNTEWVELERGALGYRKSMSNGAVKLFYDGQPGMGVHVDISGSGCRQLEGMGLVGGSFGWSEFLLFMIRTGGRFSRLDLALDDRDGLLDFGTIHRHYAQGLYVSRSKVDSCHEERDKLTGILGRTMYFGRRVSKTLIRIYDKGARERQLGREVEGDWTRVEVEFKDERAHSAALLLAGGQMSRLVGVLRGYLEFKEQGNSAQKTLWRACDWWADFLGRVEKARLDLDPVVRTVEKVNDWLTRQVAPSLGVLSLALGFGTERIVELIELGRERLRPVHWAMLGFKKGPDGDYGYAVGG